MKLISVLNYLNIFKLLIVLFFVCGFQILLPTHAEALGRKKDLEIKSQVEKVNISSTPEKAPESSLPKKSDGITLPDPMSLPFEPKTLCVGSYTIRRKQSSPPLRQEVLMKNFHHSHDSNEECKSKGIVLPGTPDEVIDIGEPPVKQKPPSQTPTPDTPRVRPRLLAPLVSPK